MQAKWLSTIFLLSIFFWSVESDARASTCDSVLKLTGRETVFFNSKDVGSRYLSYAKSRNSSIDGSFAFPVDQFVTEFSFSKSDIKEIKQTDLQSWEKTLFLSADRVFAPAVSAWTACKEAELSSLRIIASAAENGNWFSISIVPDVDTNIRFTDAHYPSDQIECQLNRKRYYYPVLLKSTNNIFKCTRKAGRHEEVEILLHIGARSYKFLFPEQERPAKLRTNEAFLEIGSCSRSNVAFPSAPFQRRLKFGQIEMHGSWGRRPAGFFYVYVNGNELRYKRTVSPEKTINGNGVIFQDAGLTFDVPAFQPIHFITGGGVDPGACLSMIVPVQIPQD